MGLINTGNFDFDYHKAITIQERSSRYLRTAFDYFVQTKSEEELDEFLSEINLNRNSSIYQHIYDDDNWNSYALEVFIYENLANKFDDPFQAIWDFGVASGSGKLDQKSNLFAMKIKVVPVPILFKKVAETASMVSKISKGKSTKIKSIIDGKRRMKIGSISWDYIYLPKEFSYAHWSSVSAGFGIVFGFMKYRKNLEDVSSKITHWSCLPSDLPHFNGKKYKFDKKTKNIFEQETNKIVGNAEEGPFEVDGIIFNNGSESICQIKWRPETLARKIMRKTIYRSRIKRETQVMEAREKIIEELNKEHQIQLSKYKDELEEKTKIIEEQKMQQDGDYFLTSLLIKPLVINRNDSKNVITEFIIRQKKVFNFRNKKSDIGGDLCITDNITLSNKKRYTVFMNADAMGKSSQGAGGALVLGVVFNSDISRTKFSLHQQDKTPEQWIKDAYLNLHNVFVTFDGTMFISVVMGLVDEETGLMYFLNAEHPFTVLYRDKKATFLENELEVRKIGVEGEEDKVRIKTFPLKENDIVILGSDGRDDIEMGIKEGNRVINEDENAFLQRVEEGRGNLKRIIVRLRKTGRFTDDLSLLRISYKPKNISKEYLTEQKLRQACETAYNILRDGDQEKAIAKFKECIKKYPQQKELNLYLGNVLFKVKKYEEAIENFEEYFHKYPENVKVAHKIAIAYKKLDNQDKAVYWAERVFLRDPKYINNLIVLSYIYIKKKNKVKAEKTLQMLESLDPKHRHIENIRRKINDL